MTLKDHVIRAVLGQIPDEDVWQAAQMLHKRAGSCAVYMLEYDHWCFEDAIEQAVKDKLHAIGKHTPETEKEWVAKYMALWKERFSDPEDKADIYDYGCILSDYLLEEIQNVAREDFESEGDLEALHYALLYDEYKELMPDE